jgi:hypothetical protein
MPVEMSDEELEETTGVAMDFIEDESDREVVINRENRKRKSEETMSDADLVFLRRKFPFLAELSDKFVRSQTTTEILKMESTALKIKMMEQTGDIEDKLACNKSSLEEREILVKAGSDNRWDKLHKGRFLGGATCTTKKLWLEARNTIGLVGDKPVGSYDMAAVGMGGFVTSRGWCELHNPGSCKNSLKLFSINNCAAKVGNNSGKGKYAGDEVEEILELGEFKLALRTLRVAAAMVMPWNYAYVALENFLLQSNFCNIELQGVDQPAKILTQFVDYVMKENANRWRDCAGFLDTGTLKSTWDAFYGARPQSMLSAKPKKGGGQSADSKSSHSYAKRVWVDICFAWNVGKCVKPVGTCLSPKGTVLRHVCNYQADRNKPNQYCEKNHARTSFH